MKQLPIDFFKTQQLNRVYTKSDHKSNRSQEAISKIQRILENNGYEEYVGKQKEMKEQNESIQVHQLTQLLKEERNKNFNLEKCLYERQIILDNQKVLYEELQTQYERDQQELKSLREFKEFHYQEKSGLEQLQKSFQELNKQIVQFKSQNLQLKQKNENLDMKNQQLTINMNQIENNFAQSGKKEQEFTKNIQRLIKEVHPPEIFVQNSPNLAYCWKWLKQILNEYMKLKVKNVSHQNQQQNSENFDAVKNTFNQLTSYFGTQSPEQIMVRIKNQMNSLERYKSIIDKVQIVLVQKNIDDLEKFMDQEIYNLNLQINQL